jgi:N-glycosylase/DNA lyase
MFRWRRDAEGVWSGMVGRRRLRLAQAEPGATLHFETDASDAADAEAFVRRFLRLDDLDLGASGEEWARADDLFAEAWKRQPGVRILRQDPEECFFAFLCASVAPIARISSMQHAVADHFGEEHGEGFRAFPTAAALATGDEARLRDLGLGFRARRVIGAAQRLAGLPEGHLAAMRAGGSNGEAKRALSAFFGVGEKIADCVCLFALDCDFAIPVDTHIWRIARTRYLPDLDGKSLTPAAYARVTRAFHDRFGPFAGWAQQTLFYRSAVAREK